MYRSACSLPAVAYRFDSTYLGEEYGEPKFLCKKHAAAVKRRNTNIANGNVAEWNIGERPVRLYDIDEAAQAIWDQRAAVAESKAERERAEKEAAERRSRDEYRRETRRATKDFFTELADNAPNFSFAVVTETNDEGTFRAIVKATYATDGRSVTRDQFTVKVNKPRETNRGPVLATLDVEGGRFGGFGDAVLVMPGFAEEMRAALNLGLAEVEKRNGEFLNSLALGKKAS